jgi:hypothetical protein
MSNTDWNEWYQQQLVPPQVLEATLKIGLIPSVDHAQAFIELKDPMTGILLGAGSVHHVNTRAMHATVARLASRLADIIEEHAEPF